MFMETQLLASVFFGILVILILLKSYKIVPQNEIFIVERFGKYSRNLESGLNFIVPFFEVVAYKRTLKEQVFDIPQQAVITKDNISINIDGVVYVKIVDPKKSCYGIDDYQVAVLQIAQTTMRSEIGKLTLESTFEERSALNGAIVAAINEASSEWGVMILRYEIKDINPPNSILSAMEMQLKADREKRAIILQSEGEKQSEINRAEGEKMSKIRQAEGEAESIRLVADAQAEALKIVGEQASSKLGQSAVQLSLAEKAIVAKQAIAKESSMIVVPDSSTEIASVVAQAISISKKIGDNK